MARQNFNARREAIARARGFPVAYESATGRVVKPKRAFYQWRQTVEGHPAREQHRRFRGGGEVIRTRSEGRLAAAIRRAAVNDQKLYATVFYLRDEHDGTHPREWWPLSRGELWESGGWRAELAERELDAVGIAFGMIRRQLVEGERYPGVVIEVELRIEE